MCVAHLLIMLYLSLSVVKFALVVYEQHNLRHNLTFDLIGTLTLGVGIKLWCTTHLLIMFYLSVKFR